MTKVEEPSGPAALVDFDQIAEEMLAELTRQDKLREEALSLSRGIIRLSARAIRAVHRGEWAIVEDRLDQARESIVRLEEIFQACPLFLATGYVADAQKEFAEAWTTYALIRQRPLPRPEDLGVPVASYLNALGEAVGELRRSILDALRQEELDLQPCEERLESMQRIYEYLVTVDFPDALTRGLRRTTDIVRRILESTRADLTTASRQKRLQEAMRHLKQRLD
jgi:translin